VTTEWEPGKVRRTEAILEVVPINKVLGSGDVEH
jgi:hypothetical protein